jgi:hypothetical protein
MASAASSAHWQQNRWHGEPKSPREAEPIIIRASAGASSRGRAACVGRGAEREKQAAKSVVFEGSGDVNTYTRRMTAKERLATASFAANCAEWRVSGPRGTVAPHGKVVAVLRKIVPGISIF